MRKRKKGEDRLINAATAFLKFLKWSPMVIGVSGIRQRELKYNFELVLGFTGKPPVPRKPKEKK